MKKVYLITLVLLLSLANSGLATRWTGDYSSDWGYSPNWDTGTPDGNEAVIEEWDGVSEYVTPTYWPEITASAACQNLCIGYESPIDETNNYGYLTIISGTVDVAGDLRVGYGDAVGVGSEDYGQLTISGGTLNIGDDMRIGRCGNGTINISGGLFMALDRAEYLDLATESGSVATINLSGGVIDVHTIGVGDGTADITISGTGMFKLDGDKIAAIQDLIDSSTIHGPDGVLCYYDPIQVKTFVIAIDPNATSEPYPEHEATSVPFDVVLHWSPGDNVGTGSGENGHQIYFSSDWEDVNDRAGAALMGPPYFRDSNEFDPTTTIHLVHDQTYYWCVDEYNSVHSDSPWEGSFIWSLAMPSSADAGPDKKIVLPTNTVVLAAKVQDDGDPSSELTYSWAVTEEPEVGTISLDTGLGPFTIDIPGDADPNEPYAVTPTVTVTRAGMYELTLYTDDGVNEANDMVQIIVREAGNTPAGPLSVSGNKIVNQYDQPVSFAGMSYFWTNDGWNAWPYYNADCVNWLVKDWRVTIVRAAMGVEDDGGYIDSPTNNKNRVIALVDAAIDAGIYVVIDWHSHHAEDYEEEAIDFFEEMATTYGGYDNVIYELYNEPAGSVSWSDTVKPYAEAVTAAIRAIDSDNLILVGSPEWSQRVDLAAADPITGYSNIAYTVHFYPGMGHTQWLRDRCTAAMNSGIALMATEWGKGTPDEEVDLWMAYLEDKDISFQNWAVNDKAEGFSCVWPGTGKYTGDWLPSDLSTSGTYVRNVCRNWPPTPAPPPPPGLVGHWKLDEGSGTTAEDSSGEENDGTLGGDPQWGAGADGNALTLDGDDYVDLGNPSVLNFGTSDFTLCAWVKNPVGNNVVAKGGDQSGGIRYCLQVGSTVQLLVDDNDDKHSVSGGSGLQNGQWHHVAGVRDGQTLRVFIDSNEVANDALPHSPYDLSGTSQHNAYIGAVWQHQDNMLGDFYTGSVDDVRIYSGALTSEDLEDVMLGAELDTTPPAAPTGLGATAISSSQINLDWDDNNEPDLAGYNVYSSETTGAPYDLVESDVTESSYSDTGLDPSTTYYYVVTAVDTSSNESSDSAEANATTEEGPPPDDSVGWWKLDETSGTTAVDSSAEENDGTLNGDPAWEVNGQVDGALDFDGTGDYVNIGNQSVLDFGTGDWTICAWIKTTAGGDVFSKGWDGSGGIRYEFNIGTTIKLEVDDNSNKVRAYGTTTVNDGYWHHVAVMRDGTTLRTYTDGDPEGTNTVSSGYDLSGTSQGSAYIGVIYDDGDSEFNTFFDGLIDDVHIYDYALTEQEIAAVMGS